MLATCTCGRNMYKQQHKPHIGTSPLEARSDYLDASSYTNKQQSTIITVLTNHCLMHLALYSKISDVTLKSAESEKYLGVTLSSNRV